MHRKGKSYKIYKLQNFEKFYNKLPCLLIDISGLADGALLITPLP